MAEETPSDKISRSKIIYDELLRRKREGLFCRKCSRYFEKRTAFNHHLKEHLKKTYGSTTENFMNYIENYICSKCGKQFEVKSDLIIHYNTACIDALYICKHCNENCETFPFLQVHLAFFHNYTEEMLRSEGFLTNLENDNFDVFMTSSIHKELISPPPEVENECSFEDAGLSISAKKTYSRKSRKPRIKSNKRQNLAFNLLNKAHTCEICNESFSRKCVLEIHVQKHVSTKNEEKKILRAILTKSLPVHVSESNSMLTQITKNEKNTDDSEVAEQISNIQKSNLESSKIIVGSSLWKKPIRKRKLVVKSISPRSGTQKCKKTRVLKVKAQDASKPKAISQLSNKDVASGKWNKIKLKMKIRNVANSDKPNDSEKSKKMKRQRYPKIKIAKETKNGEEKVFPCELCKKEFKDGYKLRRHFLIHTGLRPFTCTKCKKAFVRDDHLKRHVKRVCSKTDKAQ